jgi:formylglycine-generating enzyme required for sulfatase activity
MGGVDVCNDPECPMTRVSLFGAMRYANWLSSQQGLGACYTLNNCSDSPEYSINCESVTVNAASVYECEGYRLPTEVEWEYAARAGARTTFFAGAMSPAVADDIGNCVQEPALDDWEWYCFNVRDNRAHSVRKKGANAWGLHDVQGNVSEFVSNPLYTRLTATPAVDPWGNVDVSLTMGVRGGYFHGLPDYARLACRTDWRLGGDAITGFRLVRTLKD